MSRYVKGDQVSLDAKAAQAAGFAGVTEGTITYVDYDEVLVQPKGGGPFTARPFRLDQVTVTRERIEAGQRVTPALSTVPRGTVRGVVYTPVVEDGAPRWCAVVKWDDGPESTLPLARLRRLGLQEELAARRTAQVPAVAAGEPDPQLRARIKQAVTGTALAAWADELARRTV